MVRFHKADIHPRKKRVIRKLEQEWEVDVRIVGGGEADGWIERIMAKMPGPAFACNTTPALPRLLLPDSLIVVKKSLVERLTPKGVEQVVLHEVGHHVYWEMDEEEFAEKFAMKYFSGSWRQYGENWAEFAGEAKDVEPGRELGGDIV